MKRGFDILMATFGLIALAGPLLILAGVHRFFLGSPLLFRQRRLGHRAKPFTIYKLRTMSERRGEDGGLAPDVERLMPFGLFLRRSSLDELPELVNVLKGDMSLVGPRPLLPQYLDRYTERQARRHEVRPGITGLTQVEGRNLLSWEEKLELDVRYVETRSFWLDLKILARTVATVVNREGIEAKGHATTPEFKG